ncbi:MAG: DEAD/DEAH box helicase [Polyangiaceae bacterium]
MTFSAPVAEPAEARSPRSISCVPHMRLFAERVHITSLHGLSCRVDEVLVPLVALAFDYEGTRVRASDDRPRIFRSAASGHVEALLRDRTAEGRAQAVLERLGALEVECVESIALPDGCEAEYVVRADGDEHAFCAFTARAIANGRALGWHVEVDEAYPFRVVDSEPSWYASVEPSGERPDWFGLELGIDLDGRRVDLLPAILELLDRADAEGGLDSLVSARASWSLRVTDTHYLNVPKELLRAILRVVAELYQGAHRGGRDFPAVRAGALGELDASFGRAGAPVVWNDRCGAAARARAASEALVQVAAPEGLRATLRPYQSEGVAFLQRLREAGMGGVLADEMGLGKTLQTIAHLCKEEQEGRLDRPALVVAPTTLVSNWAREIARFAPHLRVVVLHGAERHKRWSAARAAHVVVTTYPVLVRDEALFAEVPFSAAILDEAQTVKNARSQARRALEQLQAESRVCLTGTPVENHLGELWSIFDWLAPGLLGDELAFRRFWRQPIEQRRDADRLAALRALVAPFVLRRLKRDVATELPAKTELAIPVELGGKQRELYEAIRVAAHADVRRAIRVKGFAGSSIAILGALTKLRQVCCDPRLVAMDAARPVGESAKLDALLQMLDHQLAGGHRVLVFSQFTSMLALASDALRARGVRHLILTGETGDRQRRVDAFEGGEADVFLISLKAGGTGLNLTSADTVIHYDPWWNPAAQAQATDRAYRIGQRRPVFAYSLYVAGSVEERVIALQARKRRLSNAVLGDGAAGALGENDVEELFAPLET